MSLELNLYDTLETISIERFEEVMKFLKEKRISPRAMQAYGIALDIIDMNEQACNEAIQEGSAARETVDETYQQHLQSSLEEAEEEVWEDYRAVHDVLINMELIDPTL